MICPVCHAEYEASISRCSVDDQALVDRLPEETGATFAELEAALADGSAKLSAARTMEDAKADQELLHEAGVPCLLYANPASVGANGTPKAYHLALLERDLEAAAAALGRKRQAMLEAEGMSLDAADAVIDLAATEVTCPACGFKFAPSAAAECPDCGLFLGREGQ